MNEIKTDDRERAAFGFTYTHIPGTYRCVKARYGDALVGGLYSREFIDALAEKFDVVVAEPRRLAEVLPFVPRPTPEQEAQVAVIALLERYAELARAWRSYRRNYRSQDEGRRIARRNHDGIYGR